MKHLEKCGPQYTKLSDKYFEGYKLVTPQSNEWKKHLGVIVTKTPIDYEKMQASFYLLTKIKSILTANNIYYDEDLRDVKKTELQMLSTLGNRACDIIVDYLKKKDTQNGKL